MSKTPDPFGDQDVNKQLDSWAAALEMAVAKLSETLADVRAYQERGNSDDRAAKATGDAAGEHQAGG